MQNISLDIRILLDYYTSLKRRLKFAVTSELHQKCYAPVSTLNIPHTQGSLTSNKVRVTVLDILVHPMTGIAVTGGNTSASCSAPAPASFVWFVFVLSSLSTDRVFVVHGVNKLSLSIDYCILDYKGFDPLKK